MSQNNEKLLELLISEVRGIRQDMDLMEHRLEKKIDKSNDAIATLKTRFMLVAITMGLAGGKISAVLPFLK